MRPKAMTFAKGLANGLSIGGVVAEASMMNTLTTHSICTAGGNPHSICTAGGNPVAMAAANAVLDFVESHSLQLHANHVGRRLGEGHHKLADHFPMIGEVRGSGLIWGLEVVHPHTLDPDPIRAADLIEHARDAGLLIGGGACTRTFSA
ncbi:aminotransferase class III-fold pyridoxal phosphate-dependent enzyme [Rhodococcus qingshengii]|uniref:aminotransferase class III-fold pyridoxal phosphate-dependent enzyme n=1 Tax=Rhodococcus qingshengii TaxID=334542 RepID=UPI0036DCA099